MSEMQRSLEISLCPRKGPPPASRRITVLHLLLLKLNVATHGAEGGIFMDAVAGG